MKVPIDSITIDRRFQAREHLDPTVITEYIDALERGEKLPALSIVQTPDRKNILVDGFHRIEALQELDELEAEVDLIEGPLSLAYELAAAANKTHGLQRTHADKQKAISLMFQSIEQMDDETFQKKFPVTKTRGRKAGGFGWTATAIADIVGVSIPTVTSWVEKNLRTAKNFSGSTRILEREAKVSQVSRKIAQGAAKEKAQPAPTKSTTPTKTVEAKEAPEAKPELAANGKLPVVDLETGKEVQPEETETSSEETEEERESESTIRTERLRDRIRTVQKIVQSVSQEPGGISDATDEELSERNLFISLCRELADRIEGKYAN